MQPTATSVAAGRLEKINVTDQGFGGSIVMYPPGSNDLAMSLLKFIETFPLPPGVSLKFNAELINKGTPCKSS